ncbi:alpha/beta hydrolase [Candidatus Poribacteria bacterium]|nr:alpha/beta hydrolase [Candidatus Poribacteria bacterium]MBT5531956.1 alpha/beta hydrolase [Candidatus Poribacteria bacterium]MBT5710286.1 alpha/beta hydrolase [Candidatus Poribacteria bacterium]MBT7101297.1 alpha/beta hydrolase [Candidatus Poribacteria bacterium]MBT7809234.1 alpha/beta hydrolase [Candidatus Poribacteria bacterium]
MIPDGVEVARDVAYATRSDGPQLLDVYWRSSGDPKPVIVWIHGGGWMGGDKSHCEAALSLLDDGYAVASISYRLSHEATFPAQLHDCRAAVGWLRSNAETYNLNPRRIGAWGASAGGHLAALLGTADGRLRHGDYSANGPPASVQAVCDWFGPTDFLRMNDQPGAIDHGSADSPESRLVGGPIREHPDRVAEANPATYVTSACPPFLIMHGAQDDLVLPSQSEILHDALTRAGVPSELVTLEGLGHGFGPDYPERVMEPVREFFRRHLRP